MTAGLGFALASDLYNVVADFLKKKAGGLDAAAIRTEAERIVREVIAEQTAALQAKIAEVLARLEIEESTAELAAILEGVDKWFKPAALVPNIFDGAQVTQMPADWKPDQDG